MDIKKGLIDTDGRVGPVWEHFTYWSFPIVFASTVVWMVLHHAFGIDWNYLPLGGYGLAVLAGIYTHRLDRQLNENIVTPKVDPPRKVEFLYTLTIFMFVFTVFLAVR